MDATRRQAIHEAMVRLSDGDRTAFDVLLDLLWPVILSFAERGVGRDDAEDIAQEVFFKLCARIADFDRTRDGLSWAFGIASFEMMTHRRRQHRRRETGDSALATQPDDAASQEELLMQREVAKAFTEAVGTLTEEDRRALGIDSEPEVGASSAAHRKRKQRALDRLREVWRELYGSS